MSASPLTECPKDLCAKARWGKGAVKRGIGGGAGLIFKGSGFYITDYRSESYKQAAQNDKPAAAPAKSADSSGGSSAAPAAKAPAASSGSKPPPKTD